MALDIIGVLLIVLFFIRGYMKGIIIAVFALVAIVLGAICALKLSHTLAQWFYDKGFITSGWGQLISYIILFLGVVIIVRLIAKAIEASMKATALGWLNKTIGGLFYAFIGAFVWSILLWLMAKMDLLPHATLSASKTYPYFSKLAPWVVEQTGKLLPFAKNIFADLQSFFEQVNHKLPQHVDTAR